MDILLVMNPQNSFLSKNGSVYMGERAEILKVRIIDFLSGYSNKKVFFKEKHAFDDNFFISDKTHSIAATDDFQIEDSLKKHATDFLEKTRYSAFFNTGLEQFLIKERVKDIGLMGVETHTSILFTAEDLRNRGYEVTIIEPCTMSRDNFMHDFSLTLMKNYLGVKVSQ